MERIIGKYLFRVSATFLVFGIFLFSSINSSAQIRFKRKGSALWSAQVFPQADSTYRVIYQTIDGAGGCPHQIQFIKMDTIGNMLFHKSINTGYCNGIGDIIQYRNEFYICGFHVEAGADTVFCAITKLDIEGNLIKHARFGSQDIITYNGSGYLLPVENENILVAGLALLDSNYVSYGSYLFKIDTAGNYDWGKVYYSDIDTSPMAKPIRLRDGNYLFHVINNDFPNVFSAFLKIDPQGNIIWSTSLHKQNNEYFILDRIIETTDRGFVLGGSTIDPTGTYYNAFILRCDSLMHPVNGYRFDFGSFLPWFSDSFIMTKDSGFVLMVETYDYDLTLIKLDNELNFKWAKAYPGTMQIFKLAETLDSGFVFSSYDPDTIYNINKYSMIKTDKHGNTACETYDTIPNIESLVFYDSIINFYSFSTGERYPSTAVQTVGGSIMNDLLCYCDPKPAFNYGVSDFNITFINSSINVSESFWDFGDGYTSNLSSPGHTYASPGTYLVTLIVTEGYCKDTLVKEIIIDEPITSPEISLFPNPNNGQFDILYSCKLSSRITIYNAIGQLIYNDELTAGSNLNLTIDFSQNATGIYLLVWETGGGEKVNLKFLLVK